MTERKVSGCSLFGDENGAGSHRHLEWRGCGDGDPKSESKRISGRYDPDSHFSVATN